jgi:cytochrome P450
MNIILPPTKLNNNLSKEGSKEEEEEEKMPFSRPSLLKSDPPYHRTLRDVVASACTPMAIYKLEPRSTVSSYKQFNKSRS